MLYSGVTSFYLNSKRNILSMLFLYKSSGHKMIAFVNWARPTFIGFRAVRVLVRLGRYIWACGRRMDASLTYGFEN